jgi:DNA-directed RNA polymerase subunit RPC12/RpoP
MINLKCQQCGAALHWDGQGNVVQCTYCGAEYLMHPRQEKLQKRVDPYVGTGEVQGIPIIQGNDCSGLCPISSYVPKGWQVCARQAPDDYYGDHVGNPFVVEAEYRSPDHSAFVLYRGPNSYTDRKLSRVPLLKQIDVLGSYLRVGSPFGAEQYCDYLAQRDLQPVSGQKLKVEEADGAELERQKTIYNQYAAQGFQQITSEWKRVFYSFAGQDRKQKTASVETRLNDVHKGMQSTSGSGFFGQLMGQMFNMDEHYWETQYEFIIVADREAFDRVYPIAQKINESIREAPDLDRIRQSLIQYLQNLKNQTAMAVHQQEMASWNRRSQIIMDTHNHAMNTMREMNANTAATHQRVANMHSEMIRGVNTYHTVSPGYGRPDVVEADVRWDHVYQNTQNPDVFVSTENIWLDPGVDFEELKRTNGNY